LYHHQRSRDIKFYCIFEHNLQILSFDDFHKIGHEAQQVAGLGDLHYIFNLFYDIIIYFELLIQLFVIMTHRFSHYES